MYALEKRAEAIANNVQKGNRFGVCGRLQINKYVDKEGNNRWSTDVLVEDIDFLQDKGSNNSAPSQNNPPDNPAASNYSDMPVTPIDDGDIPF